ncbi:MAG: phospho-sugar mutase [Deltaproteobacteria bacterium]|nr:phospho-sugar mutase [Deltaproteobacteria bacterium]
MDALREVEAGFDALDADAKIKAGALANLKQWLGDNRLADYRQYITHLIDAGDWSQLLDSFWRVIPFGTGGRRGPVGAGPNRINPHTINLSVQGHCEYLRDAVGLGSNPCVVVAYDVRQFFDLRGRYRGIDGPLFELTSRDMARNAAMTYAANGVTAYVVGPLQDEPGSAICTDRYISTPELSFLIRELEAAGGLNISASHNHPDDNGGKFYNRHGGQEIPPDDEALLKIVECVSDVSTMDYGAARKQRLIRLVPRELHDEYIQINTELCPVESRSARIGFTPLCGTGSTTVEQALNSLGFEVVTVPEQSVFDGSFASVRYRIGNPEVPESMDRLETMARKSDCDVAFATDPDADRLGMIVPDRAGDFRFVNGNEIGVLLLQSILNERKRAGTLPAQPIFINTLVTSSLQREIARRYGCQVIGDLMVGFKYMGDVLGHLERSGQFPPPGGPTDRDRVEGQLEDFIFTTEESHGYLLTPRVRDKDACGAAVHLAGLASELKDEGRDFVSMLRDIYRVYGYHRNVLRSLVMEGIVGLERIGRIQDVLRKSPPTEIAGLAVRRFVDNHVVGGPFKSSTDEASRNVLLFELDGGDGLTIRLVVRPSGTEPKTKLYVEVPSPVQIGGTLDDATPETLAAISDDQLDRVISETDTKAAAIGNAFIRYCLGPQVLGEVYPEIPDESLLVSDLVPVDHKVRLCTEILPGLVERLADGGAGGAWLDDQLRPFGEDPRGMVKTAARAWFERAAGEGRVTDEARARASELFEV